MCSVREEEYVAIEVMVDSGAIETVMTRECLNCVIDITNGVACKNSVEYETANGEKIPNLGERRFLGITEDWSGRSVVAQICSVNKNLMSVSKSPVQATRCL